MRGSLESEPNQQCRKRRGQVEVDMDLDVYFAGGDENTTKGLRLEMTLEVQLVRTINYIKVLETYLSRLMDDQSRPR